MLVRVEIAFGLKPILYKNFVVKQDEYKNNFYIATPEKALIDFLYFKAKEIKKVIDDIFDLSFRLQNLQIINVDKLKQIAEEFEQKKLLKLVDLLIKHLEKEQ